MDNKKQESRCNGNCMGCNPFQRQFCASQLSYNNMRMIEQLAQLVDKIEGKIEALQNNEALLIDPLVDTAQKGDGAEE